MTPGMQFSLPTFFTSTLFDLEPLFLNHGRTATNVRSEPIIAIREGKSPSANVSVTTGSGNTLAAPAPPDAVAAAEDARGDTGTANAAAAADGDTGTVNAAAAALADAVVAVVAV